MRSQRKVAALAVGVALVAAACGGGSSSDESTANTVDANVKSEVQKAALGEAGATSTTATAAKAPASMEEWEALWAKEREAVLKRIKDNKWGLQADGKTVLGPEGFTIDLSKCAPGWSNTEGVGDVVEIGNPTPQSGTLADAGNISKGAQVIFDHYNAQGAFKDVTGVTRKVTLLMKDDGYDPNRTIPLVDEFLDADKTFAIKTLGTAGTMRTYGKINDRCVPQPFSVTGHPAWGDPVNHPWTTGILMAYNTEAVLWGTFIDQRIDELTAGDGKVTVASLIMNNDFGKSYDAGFKAYLATSPNKDKIEYVSETIEPQAPTVTDPMTSLASKNPDVFIQMLAGTPCAQSITEAAQNGMKQSAKYLFAASVCKPSTYVGEKAVGNASDGWWIMGGGFRDVNSPSEDNNPFIVWFRDKLKAAGLDPKLSGNFGTGASTGWGMAQAMMIASQMDGGLTRVNFIIAQRAIEMTNPMYLEGIKFNMNGNKDAYFIEGTEVAKYDFAKQTFVQQGDIIELSGKSANCNWDQAAARCS